MLKNNVNHIYIFGTAGEFPNFVGVKYTGRELAQILKLVRADTPLQFYLTDISFGYACIAGECGYLIAMGSINFKRAWEYFHFCKQKKLYNINEYQNELCEINQYIHKITDVPKIDGAYDKMYMKLINNNFPLRLLPPYETNTDEVFEKLVDYLRKNYPQWLI